MFQQIHDDDEGLGRASAELLLELFGATGEASSSESALLPAYVHFESATAAAKYLSPDESKQLYAADLSRVRVTADPTTMRGLLRSPGVRAISMVERLSPSMNFAAAVCTVPEFKEVSGLSGRGVLIGVIDSGVDATNPMLAGQILAIWDQTLSGPPSGAVPFGKLLAPANFSQSTDSVGHGTHVAGIVAGKDAVFGGVADGAELIIVKSNLDDADVEQTLHWLKSISTDMQRPMVVNLSMEGRMDPHDGSGSLCEAIDTLSGPGFIVCCASGNTGGELDHVDVELGPGSRADIPFELLTSANAVRSIIKGWADSTADLTLSLTAPNGQRRDVSRASASGPGGLVSKYVLGDALIDVVLPKADPAFNGAVAFLVSLKAQGSAPIDGSWVLHVENTGLQAERVHVWSAPVDAVRFRADVATDRVKIGAPGAAQRAITVGALVTRVAWLDDGRNLRVMTGHHRFEVASFSSPGPLRSQSGKPDMVAPGAQICSARSSAAPVPTGYAVSQHYRMWGGSSMATPFIAGVVALMLEADRNMTPEDIKQRLCAICTIPGLSPGAYNSRWGYGLPDLVLL